MRVLLACEKSGCVTTSFRRLGFDAWSCDLLSTTGKHPEYHIQDDVLNILNDSWDLIIAFPPCTYLTVTGNSWFNVSKYGAKAIDRIAHREKAVKFFMQLANASCPHIAIENPVGVMSTRWRKPDQIVQPWMFGDAYTKRTCLWLKNLPKLQPTKIVDSGEFIIYKSGARMPKWYAVIGWKTREEKEAIRSKTFPGISNAIVTQWGQYVTEKIINSS